MAPWGAFAIGVGLSNLFQWSKSVSIQNKKMGLARWLDYWQVGLPHMVMNFMVDTLVCIAWSEGWLDKLATLIPGGPEGFGVPYTPPVGVVVGAGCDIFADQIAFTLRKLVGSRLPFLKTDAEPKPPEEAQP